MDIPQQDSQSMEFPSPRELVDEATMVPLVRRSLAAPDVPVAAPTAIYVVAALFFAKGIAWLVAQVEVASSTREVDLFGFMFAGVVALIGWKLAHFRDKWRGWAQVGLRIGIALRLLIVVMVAFLVVEISGGDDSKLRSGYSAHMTFRFGRGDTQPRLERTDGSWYVTVHGKKRSAALIDAVPIAAALLLGIALNLWQLRVLRRPEVIRLFDPANHGNPVGQMSITRFLLLTTFLLSVFLGLGKLGFLV